MVRLIELDKRFDSRSRRRHKPVFYIKVHVNFLTSPARTTLGYVQNIPVSSNFTNHINGESLKTETSKSQASLLSHSEICIKYWYVSSIYKIQFFENPIKTDNFKSKTRGILPTSCLSYYNVLSEQWINISCVTKC